MITIDGSQGEGGGQVVRSSLALSLVTGKPVTIENVRAGRKKPGLMRQHLAGVWAAREIGQARVDGDDLGSKRLVFSPESITPGEYRFSIGSAGSTTLVMQAILPALMLADGHSRVELTGGTHNPLAPPFDFLAKCYLPLLAKIGPKVTVGACEPGFYPAGGGRFEAQIRPASQLRSLHVLERGKLVRTRVTVLVSRLPMHIGHRECKVIARKLGWPNSCFVCTDVTSSPGPGNVVMIELKYKHLTEVFTTFGEKGKKAERVASEAIDAVVAYMEACAPIGPYLADQIMLPMSLAAQSGQPCSFRTMPLSPHAKTHIEVLKRFLTVDIDVQESTMTEVRFRPAE